MRLPFATLHFAAASIAGLCCHASLPIEEYNDVSTVLSFASDVVTPSSEISCLLQTSSQVHPKIAGLPFVHDHTDQDVRAVLRSSATPSDVRAALGTVAPKEIPAVAGQSNASAIHGLPLVHEHTHQDESHWQSLVADASGDGYGLHWKSLHSLICRWRAALHQIPVIGEARNTLIQLFVKQESRMLRGEGLLMVGGLMVSAIIMCTFLVYIASSKPTLEEEYVPHKMPQPYSFDRTPASTMGQLPTPASTMGQLPQSARPSWTHPAPGRPSGSFSAFSGGSTGTPYAMLHEPLQLTPESTAQDLARPSYRAPMRPSWGERPGTRVFQEQSGAMAVWQGYEPNTPNSGSATSTSDLLPRTAGLISSMVREEELRDELPDSPPHRM